MKNVRVQNKGLYFTIFVLSFNFSVEQKLIKNCPPIIEKTDEVNSDDCSLDDVYIFIIKYNYIIRK